jgi:hypothetical protein
MVIVGSLPGRGRSSSAAIGAFDHRPFYATLDGLMMEAERSAYRKKRRVFPIRQQNPRPLDPARRFGSRLRYRTSTSPHRDLRATTQSPAATLPKPSVFVLNAPAHIGA